MKSVPPGILHDGRAKVLETDVVEKDKPVVTPVK
jgi:hypothetical protein